jgi:hypothetical protein
MAYKLRSHRRDSQCCDTCGDPTWTCYETTGAYGEGGGMCWCEYHESGNLNCCDFECTGTVNGYEVYMYCGCSFEHEC